MPKTSFPMWSRRRNAVCEWSGDPCHDWTNDRVSPVKREWGEDDGKVQDSQRRRPPIALNYFIDFTCATS